MTTFDVNVTTGRLPYGPDVEIIARRNDCNLPSVVMDWSAAVLHIDATNYTEPQIVMMCRAMEEAIRNGAEAVGRWRDLVQLREDLRLR